MKISHSKIERSPENNEHSLMSEPAEELGFYSRLTRWVKKSRERIETVENVVDAAAKVLEEREKEGTFSAILKTLGMNTSDVLVASFLAMDLGEAIFSEDKLKWKMLMAKLALVFVIKGGVNKIWEYMTRKYDGVIAQGPEDLMFAGVTTIIMLAVGYTTGAQEYTEKDCKTVWDVMSKKGRDIFNIKSGVVSIMSIFVFINEMVVECAIGIGLYETDTPKSVNKKFKTHLYLLTTKLSALSSVVDKSELDIGMNKVSEFNEIVEHRKVLCDLKATGLIERQSLFAFGAIQRDYEMCRNLFSTKYKQRSVKVDPPHVSFYGWPGTGKASVIQNFVHIMMRHFGWDMSANVFFTSGNPKYFDGYKGQKVMVIDEKDAISSPDAVVVANEIQSGVPKYLDMAIAEQKGRPFCSCAIISSTNVMYPKIDEVANIAAYHRRRILVNCEPTREFLQHPVMERDKHIDNEMLSHLTFTIMKFTDQNVYGHQIDEPPQTLVGLTFAELIRHLLTSMHEKLAYQYRNVKQIEPDFPFEIPGQRYQDIEVAIAEMIAERALNLDSVNYATADIKSTLTRGEFEREMRATIECYKTPKPIREEVRTIYTDADREVIKEKLEEYRKRIRKHVEEVMHVSTQGPVSDDEYLTSPENGAIPAPVPRAHFSGERRIPNPVPPSCEYTSLLDECEDIYPEALGDRIYYRVTARNKVGYLLPTPTLTLYFLLSSRAKIVDCLASEGLGELCRKYKMSPDDLSKFLKHQVETMEAIDREILTDTDLRDLYSAMAPVVEEQQCSVSFVGGIKEKFRFTITSVKAFAKNIFKSFPVTIIPPVHELPEGFELNGRVKNIFQMIVGRVPGKFWVLPTAPVSYATLMSYDLRSYSDYQEEARRTGVNRNSMFYFLQSNNNRMMDVNNGFIDSVVNNARLCIEAYLFFIYGSLSMMSFVIGMLTRCVKKIIDKIWKKIKENPKVTVAVGVLALGCFLGYQKYANGGGTALAEGCSLNIQGHTHVDVPEDGKVHSHIHQCEICLNPYSHAHKKNAVGDSMRHTLWCSRCRHKKNKNADVDGFYVDEADAVYVYEDEIEQRIVCEGAIVPESKTIEIPLTESFSPAKGFRQKAPTRIFLPKGENFDEYFEKVRFMVKGTRGATVSEGALEPLKIEPLAQGPVAEGTRSVIFPVIDQKMTQACLELDLGGMRIKALALGNYYLLCYRHILERRIEMFTVVRAVCLRYNIEVVIEISKDNFYPLRDFEINGHVIKGDLAIIKVLNQKFSPGPDMVKFFAKENTISRANYSQGYLFGKQDGVKVVNGVGQVELKDNVSYPRVKDGPIAYATGRTWQYTYPTSNGYCGSVLVFDNPNLGSSVIGGIHVSGVDKQGLGYTSVVTQEMIFDVIKEDTFVTPECMYEVAARYHLKPSILLDATTQQKDSIYEARGTACFTIGHLATPLRMPYAGDIKTSPLFDNWEHNLEPVPLHHRDPRLLHPDNPASKASEKFNLETGGWDPKYQKKVITYQIEKAVSLYYSIGTLPTQLLSEDEAINGIPGLIESINMATAPGFPTEREKGLESGKKWAFTNIGTEQEPKYVPGPRLRERLDRAYRTVVTGVFPDNMVKDVLKVEKRKIERVQECETRLFNICDLVALICMKRIAGVFVALQLKARWKMDSTVGINMLGFDVTEFFNYIGGVGENYFEGDFSEWDGRFDAQTMKMCIDIVHGFNEAVGLYDQSFTTRRGAYTILHTAVFRYHVMGDVVYFIFVSMNSGIFVTSSFNTLGNSCRTRMVWYEIVDKAVSQQLADMHEFAMKSREDFCNYGRPSAKEIQERRLAVMNEGPEEEPLDMIEFNSMTSFDENVRIGCNGDDIIGAVSIRVKPFFNSPAIAKVYLAKNILYTPPEKPRDFSGYEDDGFRKLEQVQFLKCTFRRDENFPNLIRAMMAKRTIEDLPAWVRLSPDDRLACQQNISDALAFASHHGEEYYYSLLSKIRERGLIQNKIVVPVELFEDHQTKFYNECGVFY